MSNLLNSLYRPEYDNIRLKLDHEEGVLWLYMNHKGVPCFSSELITDIRDSHRILQDNNGYYPDGNNLQKVFYQVMTSEPGQPYNLGGDLDFFLECVSNNDRKSLRAYAKLCLEGLYPTVINFNSDVTTIALVRDKAFGGGFESALSSSIIIAERSAKMGLPEVLFNLFPGMGAYHLLARRIPIAQVEKMILSGKLYDTEELYEMGIVDVIAEDGFGELSVMEFIKRHKKKWNTQIAVQKIRDQYRHIEFNELMAVCDIWVDSMFNLTDRDIKTIRRLSRSQDRLVKDDRVLPLEAS
jgi:DSF synthase